MAWMVQEPLIGLNPCCSGQWSSTSLMRRILQFLQSLNPCCSGQWSSTKNGQVNHSAMSVLILVVVDNGLVLDIIRHY